jgi:hypothetical protein
MTLLTCSAVRRRLPAFYDRELPVRELIAVEAHLNGCPPCARDLDELQAVGDALRVGAAPAPADEWAGLQPGVISRMRAEEHDSWGAWASRTFDDWHLVWIGLASTTASLLCGGLVLSMFYFASPSYRPDSLAGFFAVLAAPSGSDLNPARLDNRYQVPSVPSDSVVFAALERRTLESTEDVVVPLSAIVRRDGWMSGLEAIDGADDRQDVERLVDALSRGRFEPAQFGGSPVAVNLVWLVAHTTVKAQKGRL